MGILAFYLKACSECASFYNCWKPTKITDTWLSYRQTIQYACLVGDKHLQATVGLNPALGYTYKTAVLVTQCPSNKLLYY